VDAVLTADPFVGDRTPFAPERLRAAVVAIADPGAVGISPIAGLLEPCGRHDDGAVALRFGGDRAVRAPISPGLYADVPVERCERVAFGHEVEVRGPGVLAFDGDRRRKVAPGATVRFRVERDGPWVFDVAGAMAAAAAAGAFVR
jgi:NAD+ kinase